MLASAIGDRRVGSSLEQTGAQCRDDVTRVEEAVTWRRSVRELRIRCPVPIAFTPGCRFPRSVFGAAQSKNDVVRVELSVFVGVTRLADEGVWGATLTLRDRFGSSTVQSTVAA